MAVAGEPVNIAHSLLALCQSLEGDTKSLNHYVTKKVWSLQDQKCILDQLSKLLNQPQSTGIIIYLFRPLLLDLLSRSRLSPRRKSQSHAKLSPERFKKSWDLLTTLAVMVTKGSLYAERFLVNYFENEKALIAMLINSVPADPYIPPAKKKKLTQRGDTGSHDQSLGDLLETMYRLVRHDALRFTSAWSIRDILPFLNHSELKVRWFAVQLLGVLLNMNSLQKRKLRQTSFTEEETSECLLKYHDRRSLLGSGGVKGHSVDPSQRCLLSATGAVCDGAQTTIQSNSLCCDIISVRGVTLTKDPDSQSQPLHPNEDGGLVYVSSMETGLSALALAVSSGRPVYIEGPVGCGKTSLVEHLAQRIGRPGPPKFIKVQLGDQIDSKSLLGTYCSTEVPGEFVWHPGVLTRALSEGLWLLLEDIDCAPADVITALLPVLETGQLQVPGQGLSIRAHAGFRIFMTKRTQSDLLGKFEVGGFHRLLLEKAVTSVHLQPCTCSELEQILHKKFPKLSSIIPRLISIYLMLSSGHHHEDRQVNDLSNGTTDPASSHGFLSRPGFKTTRQLSLRDLLKWCKRVSVTFEANSSSVTVLQSAIECFCDHLPQLSSRVEVAAAIAKVLNITQEKAQHYCSYHKPSTKSTEAAFLVGRAGVNRKEESVVRFTGHFAFTRQSSALLEKVAMAIMHTEPVLLVGETGTGKTSVVQYLACQSGRHLSVINMNQQSDTTDLLGGFKPIEFKLIMAPFREIFEVLFCETYSRVQNLKFLNHVQECFRRKQWSVLLTMMSHVQVEALKMLQKKPTEDALSKLGRWQEVGEKLQKLQRQIKEKEALAFSFIEGTLVQALKRGDWILLDEINLATAETLDCLSGVLESVGGSVVLLERGDVEPIVRHPDFRLFACMNPAGDVGKRDLAAGLRSRFTEVFVDELTEPQDLRILSSAYLSNLGASPTQINGVVTFYTSVKETAVTKLNDGNGGRPCYSLRTLCRALTMAARNPCQNVARSLFESLSLSFLTQLDRSSYPLVQSFIVKHVLGGPDKAKPVLACPLPSPSPDHLLFEGFWIRRGSKTPAPEDESYILTDSVKVNLRDLARVVSGSHHPVLIQGDTSVGKTSLITWLARSTGTKCVRINNHEHTDLQEYVGSYAADETGKLVFRPGVLVDAMKKGYWIILDELNLAPTDVLEALNRVLDDNRELFITETQETIRAHPSFQLFATQNPPGAYGGRKVLSKAFRNRFVELHFSEIPAKELITILHRRCRMALTHCRKMVGVMTELQRRRKGSGLFAGKSGFMTLRDLFRWGERCRKMASEIPDHLYNGEQLIADQGFLLLGGRVRKPEEVEIILKVLQKQFRCRLTAESVFSANLPANPFIHDTLTELTAAQSDPAFRHIVWTHGMRRLAILIGQALKFDEPVLLIGDTGCGKTTLCQMFAKLNSLPLHSVNCHMHTDGSHFLGSLRPVRQGPDTKTGKLFEWCDGPLVEAMRSGAVFLADEISLADDSVLERLNSVLEPEKKLVLSEKGSDASDQVEMITGHSRFRFVGTMNPSGDYGKKELSPALRNRFTEIWCPASEDPADFVSIAEHSLSSPIKDSFLKEAAKEGVSLGEAMMEFIGWYRSKDFGKRFAFSVRDILSWVEFMNSVCLSGPLLSPMTLGEAYVNGACLVFLDSLGAASATNSRQNKVHKELCLSFLYNQLKSMLKEAPKPLSSDLISIQSDEDMFGMGGFIIPKGEEPAPADLPYALDAPTTAQNAVRLLRGLQLRRPLLLEGSPGVGKTSLVTALARAAQQPLVRINLSEQTDISDLFGSDLPVEGGEAGQFAWRDGPFLRALRTGAWIVLDELNLASQSVLEGLNACFDHRAEVFVPELGRSFAIQQDKSKLFACQNPLMQGGGRKGLPKSFLNRFTQVYVDELSTTDLVYIASSLFPTIDRDTINTMVAINQKIHEEVHTRKLWGQRGGPWEFNLRDIHRWGQLLLRDQNERSWDLSQHFHLVYGDKLRTGQDRASAHSAFSSITGRSSLPSTNRPILLTSHSVQIGRSALGRHGVVATPGRLSNSKPLLQRRRALLESVSKCIDMGWMVILVGPESSGKADVVHLLSEMVGCTLSVMPMNSAMDTTELIGGFEQADSGRNLESLLSDLEILLKAFISHELTQGSRIQQKVTGVDAAWMTLETLRGQTDPRLKLAQAKTLFEMVEEFAVNDPTYAGVADQVWAAIQRLSTSPLQTGQTDTGHFEWKDSVLVKAMQQGHWLIMENANFCSASVLDRLNAVLEPGGVLAVTERGIVDGKIVEIKPHPNFRLILTMDPKHGEVSRALRNRGVEIFCPGELEPEAPFTDTDLVTMVMATGLDASCATMLVCLHRAVCERVSGTAVNLLWRCAETVSLWVQHGFSESSAMKRVCLEIYGQTQRRNEDGQAMKEIVMEHVMRFKSKQSDLDCYVIGRCHDYTLCENLVNFSMDRDMCAAVMNRLPSSDEQLVLTLAYLTRGSHSDWMLRQSSLGDTFGVAMDTELVRRFMDSLMGSQVVSRLRQACSIQPESGHWPVDLWHMPAIFQKVMVSLTANQQEMVTNLLSRFQILKKLLTYQMELETRSNGQLSPTSSLLVLSQQHQQGLIDTESLPRPVIPFLIGFFTDLHLHLFKVLQDDGYSEMFSDTVQSLDQLVWIHRLLVSCDGSSTASAQTSLILTWHWFVENYLPCFLRNESTADDFKLITQKIHDILGRDMTDFHNFSALWRQVPTLPPIYQQTAAQISEVTAILSTYFNTDELSPSEASVEDQVKLTLRSSVRRRLMNVLNQIELPTEDTDVVDCVAETLQKVRSEIESLHLSNSTFTLRMSEKGPNFQPIMMEVDSTPEIESVSTHHQGDEMATVQLWPVTSHLMSLALLRLLVKTLNVSSNQDVAAQVSLELDVDSLVEFGLENTSVSPHVLARLQTLRKPPTFASTFALLRDLSDLVTHGPLGLNSKKWLLWPQGNEDGLAKSMSLPLLSCELPQALCQLIAGESAAQLQCSVSLGEYGQKVGQLGRIRGLLWATWPLLSAKGTSQSNFRLVCNVLQQFTSCLSELQDNITEDEQKLLQQAQQLVGVASNSVDGASPSVDGDSADEDGTALLWVVAGLAIGRIMAPRGVVDPMEEITVKRSFVKSELEEASRELGVHDHIARAESGSGIDFTEGCHPYLLYLRHRIATLEAESLETDSMSGYRPDPSQYTTIVGKVNQFLNRSFKDSSIWAIVQNLTSDDPTKCLAGTKNALSMLRNLQKYTSSLETSHTFYRDVLSTHLTGVTMVSKGLEELTYLAQRKLENNSVGFSLRRLYKLLQVIPLCIDNSLQTASSLVKPAFLQALKSLQKGEGKENLPKDMLVRCLRLSLLLVRSVAFTKGCYSESIHRVFEEVLQSFLQAWRSEHERLAAEEEVKAALYKFKTHGDDSTEEEKFEKAVQETFPRFSEEYDDFVQMNELKDDKIIETSKPMEVLGKRTITDEIVSEICDVYSDLMLMDARSCDQTQGHDLQKVFIEAYQLSSELLQRYGAVLDAQCSEDSLPAQFLACHFLEKITTQRVVPNTKEEDCVPFDVYHDPSTEQVACCQPVLGQVSARINDLLQEWPEHPLLVQVVRLVEKIRSFPVTDPLMKFVTGLELLLQNLQDWESNASRHVTVKTEMAAVTSVIVQWRRLELQCWKSCLTLTALKQRRKAARWLFHLLGLIRDSPDLEPEQTKVNGEGKDPVKESSAQQLSTSLKDFMEGSPVGEYSARLQLLKTTSQHLQHQRALQSSHHGNLTSSSDMASKTGYPGNQDPTYCIFQNTYDFYRQFESSVQSYLDQQRAPIEKELKGFVKVARWNEQNFWMVKDSVIKAHKALTKYMKLFEDVLGHSVRNLLCEPSLANEQTPPPVNQTADVPVKNGSSEFTQDLADVAPNWQNLEISVTDLEIPEGSFPNLAELPRFSKKMANVTRSVMKAQQMEILVESVEEVTGDILSNIEDLQKLEVPSSLSKEKAKSEAKSINLRKRRGLAQLFSLLATMGLSFRKGNIHRLPDTMADPFLDLRSLQTNAKNPSNSSFSSAWSSCHQYFLRCLCRRAVMEGAATEPSKELGPSNIERLKGFLENLMVNSWKQRQTIIRTYAGVANIRKVVSSLTCNHGDLPQQEFVTSARSDLFSTVLSARETLEHFQLLLSACPTSLTGNPALNSDNCSQNSAAGPVYHGRLPVCHQLPVSGGSSGQSGDALQQVKEKVAHLIDLLRGVDADDFSSSRSDSLLLFTDGHLKWVSQAVDCLRTCLKVIDEILPFFNTSEDSETGHRLSFAKSLVQLRQHVTTYLSEFQLPSQQPLDSSASAPSSGSVVGDSFMNNIDGLIHRVLISVQNLHTSSTRGTDSEMKANGANTEDESNSVEGLLSSLQTTSMDQLEALSVAKIESSLLALLNTIVAEQKVNSTQSNMQFSLLARCQPLLSQYSTLALHALQGAVFANRTQLKLLSLLQKTATELLTKGFCLPAEYSDEEGSGATTFEDIEGGGLGDGEGSKDVSEQIESEDQLDEARKEGEQSKEEPESSAPPPEEENGIEMSDDFEGAMENAKPTDVDEEDSNASCGDEEEMKEQLGDLGDEGQTEKLDEKLWGSDNEEDEQGETNDREEEGTGVEAGQEEMAAKDDSLEKGKKDEKQNDKETDDQEDSERKPNVPENTDDGEEYDDNKVDPYYKGPEEAQEEKEDLELPDDLDLGGDEATEEQEGEAAPECEDEAQTESAAVEESGADEQQAEEESSDQKDTEQPEGGAGVEEEAGPAQDEEVESKDEEAETKDEEAETKDEEADTKDEEAGPQAGELQEPMEEDGDPEGTEQDVYGLTEVTAENPLESELAQDHGGEAEKGEEQSGGMATKEDLEGQEGQAMDQRSEATENQPKQGRKKKPTAADERRQVERDSSEQKTQKLNMVEDESESKEKNMSSAAAQKKQTASMYQHMDVTDTSAADSHTLDAATTEQQIDEVPTATQEEEGEERDDKMEDTDVKMAEEKDIEEKERKLRELSSLTNQTVKEKDGTMLNPDEAGDEDQMEDKEGEITSGNAETKEMESTIHTDMAAAEALQLVDIEALRRDLETTLCDLNREGGGDYSHDGEELWQQYNLLTQPLSQELCEQLRLILEPSLSTKLRGDYRTGKRLNMRKVIPYIASQFRKDKIWMRRTKPSKRQYQVMVAMDDSSSMADNHSKQLAYESLAVVANSLTLLEAGDLGVCSFGQHVELIHPFEQQFGPQAGAAIFQKLTFEQKKTDVSKMLREMTRYMIEQRSRMYGGSGLDISQLLLIVSDGRGITYGGSGPLTQSVRQARSLGLFLVFIIVDNPTNQSSILDIQTPIFKSSGLSEVTPYLDHFPFPFYIILRDINSLPVTLGDALRQWFELVTASSK